MSLPEMFENGATYTGTFKFIRHSTQTLTIVKLCNAQKTKEAPKLGDWVVTADGKTAKITTTSFPEVFTDRWYYNFEVDVLAPEEAREHQDKADEADRVAKEQIEIELKQKRKAALNDYTIAELIEAAAEKAKTK